MRPSPLEQAAQYADTAEDCYFCELEYLCAIDFTRQFSYTFHWKPTPCLPS